MMKVKLFLFLCLLIISSSFVFAQTDEKRDSLFNLLKKCNNDTCRCKTYLDIGDIYEHTFPDTAIFYYNKCLEYAREKGLNGKAATAMQYIGIVNYNQGNYSSAIENYLKAIEIFRSTGDREGLTGCYNNIGLVYSDQGLFELAKEQYLKAMKIHLENLSSCADKNCFNDKMGITNNLTNISLIYLHQGNDLKAIDYQLKALRIKEDMLKDCGDESNCISLRNGIARCYNNIGIIHYNQKSMKKAADFYNRALQIYSETKEMYGVSYCYGNFGNLYSDMALMADEENVKDSLMTLSLSYYQKSLDLAKMLNDIGSMSSCYNNLGTVLSDLGRYDDAISSYKKAIELYEITENLEGRAICFWNISDLYINLADSCALSNNQAQQYLKKAVEYGEMAYMLSSQIKTLPVKNGAAFALMKAYKKTGQINKALEFAEIFISTRDSVYNQDHSKSLAELSTKYETEKKDKENQLLRLDRELQNSTIKRQYILSISVSAGLLLMLVLAWVLYKSDKRRKKVNVLLSSQNLEIQQKNEEILTQRDEIASQRDLVTYQKEQIEIIFEELTSSIRYAQKIQHAMLPADNCLSASGLENFIIFKPKNIVSGDFYWVGFQDNLLTIAVADCTGHGVPGAFMSMLGITLLKEIILKEKITQPDEILNRTRKEVVKSLKQDSGNQRDGMDIALCTINLNTLELQFAGANNPRYIVKAEAEAEEVKREENIALASSLALIEVKGDKMPIGIHERMDAFSLHTYQLQKGDCIFMFSDGMADQFGGKDGKKLKYKQLKEILLANSKYPADVQKEKIEKYFMEWKGHLEQVDDVTVLGIIT